LSIVEGGRDWISGISGRDNGIIAGLRTTSLDNCGRVMVFPAAGIIETEGNLLF
jgi:hypothetical protein